MLKIRQMTRAELDTAVDWACREGWNPGLCDADIFWQTDPDGYLALERDGELIGSGSTVSYDGKFGFMGLFMVRSDLRSNGFGRELWYKRRDSLLARLQPGAAIGMDGVFNMQSFYAKGGFEFSHRNLRMQGTGQEFEIDQSVLSKIDKSDFELIEKFDNRCFGFARKSFMQNWLAMPNSVSYLYAKDGECNGFGTVRKCHSGWKIGPLFAQSQEVVEKLFRALNSVARDESIFLDIPEINNSAVALARDYKMTECFGCARMYHGKFPDLPYDNIYGVTTFELG